MAEGLNPKQAQFVQEYLIDLNATQAAIRAGYKPSCAGKTGNELLKNPHVAAEIADAKDARAVRVGITADKIMRETARVAFSDPASVLNEIGQIKGLRDLTPAQRAAVKSVKVLADGTLEVQFWDKMNALEKLMKHHGMFEKDNAQLNNGPPEIQVSFVGMDDEPSSEPNE